MAVAAEYFGQYHKDYLYQKAEYIYDTCLQVLKRAKAEKLNTQIIAMRMAEERIAAIANLRKTL